MTNIAEKLTKSEPQALTDLSSDMVGFWKSYTIYAAVQLKIPDCLPGTIEQISAKSNIPANKLERLLRALWELNIVQPLENKWGLTKKGQLLAPTNSSPMAAAAIMWIEANLDLWSDLIGKLQVTNDQVVPYFQELSCSTELLEQYHRALEGYATQDYSSLKDLINWKQHKKILDLGCGTGSLLIQLLQSHPHLHGIFVDLPEVITQIEIPSNLQGRARCFEQDFLQPWAISVDGIILSRVLHDWPDQEATNILKQAHQTLGPEGIMYIVEMILLDDSPQGGLLDLNMLVATGGFERSYTKWQSLLANANFSIQETKKLSNILSIIVAYPT